MKRETVSYGNWEKNERIFNNQVELIITREIGPRIIRFGFIDRRNIFYEIPEQLGGSHEDEWMIRGGHRFWIAPEEKPRTYEPDNTPVQLRQTNVSIEIIQSPGPISNIQKLIAISLSDKENRVVIDHTLTNVSENEIECAPWALSVMKPGGTAIIPLPAKIPHPKILKHTQEWSLWSYTDLSDDRWQFLPNYVLFSQHPEKGPNELGIAHKEGWIAYQNKSTVFIKRFEHKAGEAYPHGNVNFETFANQDFLELESLGPLIKLRPGHSASHREIWSLHADIPKCSTEKDINTHILPLA